MTFKLLICGREEAADVLAKNGHGVTHLVSIQGVEHRSFLPGRETVPSFSVLIFSDIIEQDPSGKARLVSPDDIARIIEMGKRISKASVTTKPHVLVHCEAGISRSTAAALIMLRVHLGAGGERAAMQDVLKVRSIANPNRLMVALGDSMLACHGALNRAVAEAMEAKRIERILAMNKVV